jgi:hypothetical protein
VRECRRVKIERVWSVEGTPFFLSGERVPRLVLFLSFHDYHRKSSLLLRTPLCDGNESDSGHESA